MRPAALQAAVYLTVAACSFACGALPRSRRLRCPRSPAIRGRLSGRLSASNSSMWAARRVIHATGCGTKCGPCCSISGARRDLTVAVIGCPVTIRCRGRRVGFGSRSSSPRRRCPRPAARPPARGRSGGRGRPFRIVYHRPSDAFRNIGIGDCELVQEFAQQLLPKLTVRDVHQDIICVPYQPNGEPIPGARGDIEAAARGGGRALLPAQPLSFPRREAGRRARHLHRCRVGYVQPQRRQAPPPDAAGVEPCHVGLVEKTPGSTSDRTQSRSAPPGVRHLVPGNQRFRSALSWASPWRGAPTGRPHPR